LRNPERQKNSEKFEVLHGFEGSKKFGTGKKLVKKMELGKLVRTGMKKDIRKFLRRSRKSP
jgi:hypothetical protein